MKLTVNLLKPLAKKTLILVGIVIAATWFINLSLFDETLIQELQDLTEPQPVTLTDNGYPLLIGLSSASDRNPFTVGKEVIALLRSKYTAGQRIELSDAEFEQVHGPRDLDKQWQGDIVSLSCNTMLAIDCADKLIDDLREKNIDDQRTRLVLQRYQSLIQQENFQENEEMGIYSILPSYTLLMNVSRVKLAADYNSLATEQFLTSIGQDLAFWKLMLRDGQTLIAKMVALVGLRNDLQYLSTLIRTRALATTDITLTQQLLRPLSLQERDIGETFLAEQRMHLLSSDYSDTMYGNTSWFKYWLIRSTNQRNATMNEYYSSVVLPLRLRSKLSAEEFYQQKAFENLSHPMRVFPPALYNLGGKLIVKELLPRTLQDYIARVHDIDGKINLVALQLEIKTKPELTITEVAKNSRFRNPYTREAMEYDSEAGTLAFDCLDFRSKDVCTVKL